MSNQTIVQEKNNINYKVYFKEYGLKSITKEDFLKLDSITIEPKYRGIFDYTIVVTGGGKPLQYLIKSGTKIDPKVREWVKERDTCSVALDELRLDGRIYPPVVISVK